MSSDAEVKGRFNRQIFAIGMAAMKRMLASNMMVLGLSGAGAETAKNICLSGVRAIHLVDNKPISWLDLGSNCFLGESDIGANRAVVSAKGIAPLNGSVTIKAHQEILSPEQVHELDIHVAILVNIHDYMSHEEALKYCDDLRAQGVRICCVDAYGLFTRIVNDFGSEFVIEDASGSEPGKHLVLDAELTTNDGSGVTATLTIDIKDSDFEGGSDETVELITVDPKGVQKKAQWLLKEKKARDTLVLTFTPDEAAAPDSIPKLLEGIFKVDGAGANGAAHLQLIQRPYSVSFKSVREAEKEAPSCTHMSFTKDNNATHNAFTALFQFQDAHGHKRPDPFNEEHSALVSKNIENESEKSLAQYLSFVSQGEHSGIASFLGGVASQEALKAVTGKFQPINQFWYFDFREVLADPSSPEEDPKYAFPADWQPKGNRFDGPTLLFGKAAMDKIKNAQVFVVGSGAIGCEYLKNLALLGVGCGPKGKITVTDNDSIEQSNLCRQFLFRNEHIGQSKSLCAANAIKGMVKTVKIRALTTKVNDENSDPVSGTFNTRFWNQQQLICGAVDNVAARQFVDDRAVEYHRPAIDGGTLGAIGHCDVFAPFATVRFRDTAAGTDEKKIPFCTLHYFPTNMDHCVQFARDFFAFLFTTAPTEANRFLASGSVQEFIDNTEPGARPGAIRSLYTTLIEDRPKCFKDCVVRARLIFENSFVTGPRNVLHSYPPNAKDQDDKPFWSKDQRMPKVIPFDMDNEDHARAVTYSARLMALVHRDTVSDVPDSWDSAMALVREMIPSIAIPPYVPQKVVLKREAQEEKGDTEKPAKTEEEEAQERVEQDKMIAEQKEEMAKHLAEISKVWESSCEVAKTQNVLSPEAFEKDEDDNGHVAVVAALANVRAAIYSIPTETEFNIKKIAGKIIPAMITTTAVVTGLCTVQAATLLTCGPQATAKDNSREVNRRCKSYQAGVSNIDIMHGWDPSNPREKRYFDDEVASASATPEPTWTTWDRFEVSGPLTMSIQEVIDAVKTKYFGLKISQLVEARSGKWIMNAMADGEQILGFPLALWSKKFLELTDEDLTARGHIDYVVKCTHDTRKVSDALPILRFTFGKKH